MQPETGAQPWWKTFLTPGWVIVAILIVLFSYFAFTLLAPWQLNKNEALVERNDHIKTAFEHDPVPIGEVVDKQGELSPGAEWTRITATGTYAQDSDVLLRLRPIDRTPSFQVLTPFHLDNGQSVLVNRGWVPAIGSTQVPDIDAPPTGEQTISGMMRVDEGVHPSAPLNDQGYTMVYSISPGQVGELTDTTLASPYVQLLSDSPGVLTAIPLPMLETGNHLSYGLQWIAFGIMAPAGLIYFIWAETRERRRFKEEQAELLDAPSEPAEPVAPASAPAAPAAPAQARSRYGTQRRNPWAKSYEKEEER